MVKVNRIRLKNLGKVGAGVHMSDILSHGSEEQIALRGQGRANFDAGLAADWIADMIESGEGDAYVEYINGVVKRMGDAVALLKKKRPNDPTRWEQQEKIYKLYNGILSVQN